MDAARQTDHKAELKLRIKGEVHNVAVDLYFKHGAMTDESLFLLFLDMEIEVTDEQIAEIRHTLKRRGLVEVKRNLVARTSDGQPAVVYGIRVQ
jgi:hypothetical protein